MTSASAHTVCAVVENTRGLSSFGSSVKATVVKHRICNSMGVTVCISNVDSGTARHSSRNAYGMQNRDRLGPVENVSPINEPVSAIRTELAHDLCHTTSLSAL